jgi:lysophospholipase L1-like esterase
VSYAPIVTTSLRRALWLVLLALLVACGERTTGPATTNPAPSPVDTPPAAVAAATPTPTRVVISGGVGVTERTGRCRVTVPGGFSEEPPRSGTFISRDRLAFVGLEALDAGAASFEEVTGSAIAGVQGLVTGYQETDAAREQDGLRVDFTGALSGRPGRGMVYFKQSGPTICQSTLIVTEGSSVAYDAAFQALTATMAATNAAAAAWPTPTAPRAPTATRTPAAAGATREIRYLALGDSYAYGTGASDPATRGYAARFAAYLKGQPGATVTTTNLAVPGATSVDLLGDYPAQGRASQSQLGQGVRLLAEGTGARANLVTIAIGGNDILRLVRPGQVCSGDAITSDPCLAAMQESVRTLSAPNVPQILGALVDAAGSGTQMIVLTYPNAFSVGARDLREQRTDLAITTLNGVITDAVARLQPRAAGRGVRLATVDLFPLFAGQAGTLTHILDSPPDIHPTDAGYAVIADAVTRTYQPPQAAQPGTAAPTPAAAARVSLPRDEAPHDAPTEWWYYTGHLRADDGARFGFQSVLFRVRRGGAAATAMPN